MQETISEVTTETAPTCPTWCTSDHAAEVRGGWDPGSWWHRSAETEIPNAGPPAFRGDVTPLQLTCFVTGHDPDRWRVVVDDCEYTADQARILAATLVELATTLDRTS